MSREGPHGAANTVHVLRAKWPLRGSIGEIYLSPALRLVGFFCPLNFCPIADLTKKLSDKK